MATLSITLHNGINTLPTANSGDVINCKFNTGSKGGPGGLSVFAGGPNLDLKAQIFDPAGAPASPQIGPSVTCSINFGGKNDTLKLANDTDYIFRVTLGVFNEQNVGLTCAYAKPAGPRHV